MAITVVRTSAKLDSSGNTGNSAFTGTPTVGNRIIGTAWTYGNTSRSAPYVAYTDNASGGSNTYTTHVERDGGSGSPASQDVGICSAPVDRTVSNLTVSVTADGGVVCFGAMEVSGLIASPVDVTAGVNVAVPTGGYDWSITVGARAQADELIVAAFCYPASQLGSYGLSTNTPWGSFTATQLIVNDGNSINSEYGVSGYAIVNDTASLAASFHANDTGANGALVAVSFKATVGGTPPHARGFGPDRCGMFTGLRM